MIESGSFPFRLACNCATALIASVGGIGCATVIPDQGETRRVSVSITQPIEDGKCPVLSGNYHETGDGRFTNGKTFVAHLMGNEFADSFYGSRNEITRKGLFVRVLHPQLGTLRMEAIVNDEVVGVREFGNSSSWYCSEQRLVKFSAKQFNIEAGSGTQINLHTFFIASDRSLCATQEWKMNYVFGGPRDTGYSFTTCYLRKN